MYSTRRGVAHGPTTTGAEVSLMVPPRQGQRRRSWSHSLSGAEVSLTVADLDDDEDEGVCRVIARPRGLELGRGSGEWGYDED